ncbi:hypothetical protein N7456_010817 [Penicillium angulare]|uniref:non-specific serine/threonine protein kinase n=1 Tax=Penicillium angulare TaxID=116970 RepID=A0A9W9ESL9_9EURO|nr:hypothetical protein N7456_010817 [Penicillium angulare]
MRSELPTKTIAIEGYDVVGDGDDTFVHRVTPTIVVKIVRRSNLNPQHQPENHPLYEELEFYKCLHERQDRCADIVECFLTLPDSIFLSNCSNGTIENRLWARQERQNPTTGYWYGGLIRVTEYEDPALIARWIQQPKSALEHVEKLGFCHNDLHSSNCLLDGNFNLKLTDFGLATKVGQPLLTTTPPRAMIIPAGPLGGKYGLCSARTEQFAVGTLLYYMSYGFEPYDDILNIEHDEMYRRVSNMEFPELNRNEVFDGLIAACWYNVYPTMHFVAYDFKRKTKDIAALRPAEYIPIDTAKDTETCKELIRKGLLGPELALRFQPSWRVYLYAVFTRSMFIWKSLLQKFWIWS